MKRSLLLLAFFILLCVPQLWAACDCSFGGVDGTSSGDSGGSPATGILVNNPGANLGDFIICVLSYDTFSHGAQTDDQSWTSYSPIMLGDGSGLSVFTQNFPGTPNTVTFHNASGLFPENWSYSCVSEAYRNALDGSPVGAAGGQAGTTATAPGVVITQTLEAIVNAFGVAGTTTLSAPAQGSIAVQQHANAPSTGIVTSTNPSARLVPGNSVTLSAKQLSGAITLALKCGKPATPTASPTATATATKTATATATGVATATPTSTPTPGVAIQKVVVIMQENQSFDSLFGTFPGANGATTATLHGGGTYTLTRAPNVLPSDLYHNYSQAVIDVNGGSMNGWDTIAPCTSSSSPPYQCLIQYLQADIPNLWTYAQTYTLGDNAFGPMLGPSLPSHLYMASGTSFLDFTNPLGTGASRSWGCDSEIKTSDCTASHTPGYNCTGNNACTGNGCGATTSNFVDLFGGGTSFTCFTGASIYDRMNGAGVTWTHYGINTWGTDGYYWTTPDDYILHTNGTADYTSHVKSSASFAADATAGTLPQVTFLTPNEAHSMHPPASLCTGENWVVEAINAIAAGPANQWNHILIVFMTDEWGGFYDHVNPPVVDSLGLGLRVPIIVVSPFSKAGAVVHTQVEVSSVLKEIEEIFSLSSLGTRDATSNDLSTFIDTSQAPLSPITLTVRAGAGCAN